MQSTTTYTVLLVVLLAISTGAFQPASSHTRRTLNAQKSSSSHMRMRALYTKEGSDGDEETTPGGESYDGDIDWDAEWAKVVKDKGSTVSTQRPGQDFYKNDAQRAAAKATRAASEQISKVKIVKPDINLKMLSGDPKFWIDICKLVGLLVIVDVMNFLGNRIMCSFLSNAYAHIFLSFAPLSFLPTVAVISVGFALISAPDMSSYSHSSANESFYI